MLIIRDHSGFQGKGHAPTFRNKVKKLSYSLLFWERRGLR